jgi:ribosome-associated translation inhibitor RaiA
MLRNAIGVDVLTTFTDVEAVDMADKNTATSADDLAKVERTVYNSLGISQNLFNTDGNLSLEKSILNDEGTIRSLKLQFEIFFDTITSRLNKHKNKYNYRFYMLETTQYNYKELSKLYKEQMNSGFSHVLPQIALGHSQSSIINTAYFENEVLHLSEIMIPPLMSSTMKMEDLKGNGNKSTTAQNQTNTDPGEAGRPEKPDDQKSDKTLANQASMG